MQFFVGSENCIFFYFNADTLMKMLNEGIHCMSEQKGKAGIEIWK